MQVPLIPTSEWLPERSGEPDCRYFLKTQRCKFGVKCKFNHPKDVLASLDAQESAGINVLPEKPSKSLCAFYMETGKCKYGASCKFHHLKVIQLPSAAEDSGSDAHAVIAISNEGTTGEVKPLKPVFTPALLQTSRELPVRMVPLIPTSEWLPERPGEPDCRYFLKTQRCKFGVKCKFNHPKDVPVSLDAQESAGINVLPKKPSKSPCRFYMKTGKCKYGASCKFHHLKVIQLPSAAEDSGSDAHAVIAINNEGTIGEDAQESAGINILPKRPSEPPCAENSDLQPAFEVLPDDLLVLIFSCLGDRGQIRLQAVCHKWKRLIATVEPRGGLLYHLGTGELLNDLAYFMLPGETVSRVKRRLERGTKGLIDLKTLKEHMHRIKVGERFEERVKKLVRRGLQGIRDWTREEVLEAAKKF